MVGIRLGFLLVYVGLVSTEFGIMDHHEALNSNLTARLNNVKKFVPPSDKNGSVEVKQTIKGSGIISLKNDELEIIILNHMTWVDRRLSWDPRNFGNRMRTTMPSEMIWIPDIMIKERLAPHTQSDDVNAVIFAEGDVHLVQPLYLKTRCMFNESALYTNNNITCKLSFSSWTYDCYELNLQLMKSGELFLDEYIESADWKILSINAYRDVTYFDCCRFTTYCSNTYTLTIQRQ